MGNTFLEVFPIQKTSNSGDRWSVHANIQRKSGSRTNLRWGFWRLADAKDFFTDLVSLVNAKGD